MLYGGIAEPEEDLMTVLIPLLESCQLTRVQNTVPRPKFNQIASAEKGQGIFPRQTRRHPHDQTSRKSFTAPILENFTHHNSPIFKILKSPPWPQESIHSSNFHHLFGSCFSQSKGGICRGCCYSTRLVKARKKMGC